MTRPKETLTCRGCGTQFPNPGTGKRFFCSDHCSVFSRMNKHESGCWIWSGAKDKHGYGRISNGRGSLLKAHRVAFKATFGDPGELFVCHKCDNPSCVNPDHLFLGSQLDNVRDMDWKGRRRVRPSQGIQHPRHKLTEENVRYIRANRHIGLRNLAAQFGVHFSTITAVVYRINWRHI